MTIDTPTRDERLLEGSGGRRWRIRERPDLEPFRGAEWPRLVSLLLAHRGVTRLEEAQDYLGDAGDLTDVGLMPGIDVAVERLLKACRTGEIVAVYGDYDVDGVTATTILVETLSRLGANPRPYIPNRFTEGYGPNKGAFERLRNEGATLIVTADCGTSAVEEIAYANELGADVIVVDHHEPPAVLPDAVAIVNAKLKGDAYGPGYGSEPAACGVAFKVAAELHKRMGAPYEPDEHLALVAMGTVCDLVPLKGENRTLLRRGLAALSRTKRPGLRALAKAAGIDLAEADPDTCGWVLGPRMNAAGRMEHASIALELLLTQDAAPAEHLASRLEGLNRIRREETTVAVDLAKELLTPEEREGPLLVVASPDISSGIVGLVAARLAEDCYRPAIVMELGEEKGQASCRSIPGFDITALLRRNKHLFQRHGGHAMAAGFTVDVARIDEAKATLIEDAARYLGTDTLTPTIDIDAELPLHRVNGDMLRWLHRLGPHGQDNAVPTFLSRDVEIREARTVGADGAHLQFTLKENRVTWRAISFRNAEYAVPVGERADIVYTFRRDNLRGTLQLEVLDLRAAGGA